MYQNTFLLIQLFFPVLLLITSCVVDIEGPTDKSLSIEWLTIDYNQTENKLFMHLEIKPEHETIDSQLDHNLCLSIR